MPSAFTRISLPGTPHIRLQLVKLPSGRLDIAPLLTILVPRNKGIQVLGRLLHESEDQVPVKPAFSQAFDRCVDKPSNILFAPGA